MKRLPKNRRPDPSLNMGEPVSGTSTYGRPIDSFKRPRRKHAPKATPIYIDDPPPAPDDLQPPPGLETKGSTMAGRRIKRFR